MNLQQLYYFQAITNFKSFTKAAESLSTTQSNLSHAIASLESELGLPLLNRDKNGVSLTEYGLNYLIHVNAVIEELDAAARECRQALDPRSGQITVAFISNLSSSFMPDLIRYFYSYHDNRNIKIKFSEIQATARTLRDLEAQMVDIAFAAMLNHEDMGFTKVMDEEMIAIVSPSHHLAQKKRVSLRELAGERLITYTKECGTRYYIEDILHKAEVVPSEIIEMETEKMMASAVASDLGVSILPRTNDLRIYDVVSLTLENSQLQRPLYMIWNKKAFERPVVKNFRETTQSFLRHRTTE